jgi:hypothetical protein
VDQPDISNTRATQVQFYSPAIYVRAAPEANISPLDEDHYDGRRRHPRILLVLQRLDLGRVLGHYNVGSGQEHVKRHLSVEPINYNQYVHVLQQEDIEATTTFRYAYVVCSSSQERQTLSLSSPQVPMGIPGSATSETTMRIEGFLD